MELGEPVSGLVPPLPFPVIYGGKNKGGVPISDAPIPVQKPNHPKGTLDLEIDDDGYLWIGLMYQTGMARFDRTAGAFRIYPVPKEWQTDATQQSHFSVAGMKVDGKICVKNTDRSQVMRLDLETGQYENLGTFHNPANGRPIGIYGIYADQQNNVYILEFPFGGIGKIDARTGKLTFYTTPTPNARARRGRVDLENRLWFPLQSRKYSTVSPTHFGRKSSPEEPGPAVTKSHTMRSPADLYRTNTGATNSPLFVQSRHTPSKFSVGACGRAGSKKPRTRAVMNFNFGRSERRHQQVWGSPVWGIVTLPKDITAVSESETAQLSGSTASGNRISHRPGF